MATTILGVDKPVSLVEQTLYDVARGKLAGASNLASYGELTTAGAVTDHLVWPLAGTPDLAVPASPGVQMAVVSSSASDAAAGTGIRTVNVIYLDVDLAQQTEIVTLNGATPVNMVATDVRFIQCMHLATAGSGKKAAGNISATNGGTTYSYIPTGKRRCSSGTRRVPAGKRLIITSLYGSSISGAGQAKSEIRLVATGLDAVDTTESAITFPLQSVGMQDGAVTLSGLTIAVSAGLVVGFEVTVDKAATISAGFNGWVETV